MIDYSVAGDSANLPNVLVQRDANGDFAAGSVTIEDVASFMAQFCAFDYAGDGYFSVDIGPQTFYVQWGTVTVASLAVVTVVHPIALPSGSLAHFGSFKQASGAMNAVGVMSGAVMALSDLTHTTVYNNSSASRDIHWMVIGN